MKNALKFALTMTGCFLIITLTYKALTYFFG